MAYLKCIVTGIRQVTLKRVYPDYESKNGVGKKLTVV